MTFISGDNGATFVAMAILGLQLQKNLFVNGDDTWDAQAYLPAYVQRYQFCMTRASVDGQEQPERIALVEKRALKPRGEALYDEKGKPLPVWDNLSKLPFEFEADLARTVKMMHKLQALQLLYPFAVQAAPTGERSSKLTGMYCVSEERLHALPAKTLKELAGSCILARAYLHLLSLGNFQRLLDRRALRLAQEKAAPKVDPKP